LGTGGFADVYLYEQSVPRRRIAVKVLLIDAVPGDLRTAFLQETNTLAHLAGHPNVLTMYEAGIAADGRPYLVTEYCPEGYGQRFRNERIPVPEVLSVGLGIGAALHTAHVAGVLHRDVKPANVLITDFGRPVLSDFGIASTLRRMVGNETPVTELQDPSEVGLSIPWAPPEALQGHI
jgi:serine/threonine protein kinase